ncbi:MAG TPA: hypothetical protein VFA26_13210 [Gemmataceae bacterium]|nr:hypothetical protein [Gemmataceae bacterium]
MLPRLLHGSALFGGLFLLTLSAAGLARTDEPKGDKERPPARGLTPKKVTLKADSLLLSKALKEVEKQTGLAVEDRRNREDSAYKDAELKLDLKGVTFWQAIDAIAKEADLSVSLYERDGKLALREGPFRQVPTSYGGIFRTTVRRISAVRDLETDGHLCVATLEVAWEPGFQPLFYETKPDSLVVKDDKMRELPVKGDGSGKAAVRGPANATEIELRLPAPKRQVQSLGLLRGSLTMTVPQQMLDFTFKTLDKEKAAKEPQLTKEGVTVKLTRLEFARAYWSVQVTLEYPKGGPNFESFQNWVVRNQLFLKRAGGDGVMWEQKLGGYSVDSLGPNRAVITYGIVDEPKRKLYRGKPEEWKVVYRTPGAIVEVPAAFEFKDVPLP